MFRSVLSCLTIVQFYSVLVAGQDECTDLRGRLIAHGLHYVPGPDTCTLCVCDNGMPKVCKAVLCSPPQDCRSFRVGNTCCEFICLDDVVKPAEGAEGNVRLAASGAAAVVLVTVALVVYRVRRQKRRRVPHADDQRSLTSIGYISGSMGYMGGTCETALAAWKPPGNYLPRGEAPPPYDEAVAQCRSDAISGWSVATPRHLARDRSTGPGRNALMIVFNDELMPACRMGEPFHRTYATTVETMARPDDLQCAGHGYVNITRPVQQVANPQGCYNAPLLQQVHPTDMREPQSMSHHPLAPNVVGFTHSHTHGIRLTGSLGAISGRALVDPPRPHPPYTMHHTQLHRTIPRFPGADLGGEFCRERVLAGEVRRSFHRAGVPAERRLADVATGRSVPRNLNIAAAEIEIEASNARLYNGGERYRARSSEQVQEAASKAPPPAPAPPPQTPPTPSPPSAQPSSAPSLPLTVDKPACSCSYAGGCGEDGDDYRSECENCNCATGSRWAQPEADGWLGGEEETQTLQRRAPAPAPPPPATATLPQPVTKPRTITGPSNWENWFNTIPDSDTESEE